MSDFRPIPFSRLKPGEILPVDIYLKIDGKYLRFKGANDSIPQDKYDHFCQQNVFSCYVKAEDFSGLIDWLADKKQDQIKNVEKLEGKETAKVFAQKEEVKEELYKTFSSEELNAENVELLKNQTTSLIKDLVKNPAAAAILAKFPDYGQSIVEHSMNVANMAVFMGLTLGHSHPMVIENLYLGALFHDFGMTRVPENIMRGENEAIYAKYVNDHPENAFKYLQKVKILPDQVRDIVFQHHEQFDGGGYPRKLKNEDIYELAKIVSMANYFDNHLVENPGQRSRGGRNPKRVPQALKALQLAEGRMFDPALTRPVIKAIKLSNHFSSTEIQE